MTYLEEECVRKVAEVRFLPPDAVTLDTSLESLEVDSLDRVTLAYDLEEKYDIELAEAKLHEIRTVRDIANAIQEALEKKALDGAAPAPETTGAGSA